MSDNRPGYGNREIVRRRKFVEEWRKANGDLCVGWQRPPHYVDHEQNPISADHIHAVAAGGAEDGALQALCRQCNSRKQAKSNGHMPLVVYCDHPCPEPWPHQHRYPTRQW